jgi:peptide/nickel transport system substrate-binding protein
MPDIRRTAAALILAASVLGIPAAGAQTLKVAMGSDVKILDPIWSTAYIQRDFGYMVWDVLFALDEKLEVKPEMVESWNVSPDQLTWTFTLRANKWSNGQPVTSEDCIA